MKVTSPGYLDQVIEECYRTVAQEGVGLKDWLSWRYWRAEWVGKLAGLQIELDHQPSALMMWARTAGNPEGHARMPREPKDIIGDIEHASAMVALLEDCAAVVKAKSQKGRKHDGAGAAAGNGGGVRPHGRADSAGKPATDQRPGVPPAGTRR